MQEYHKSLIEKSSIIEDVVYVISSFPINKKYGYGSCRSGSRSCASQSKSGKSKASARYSKSLDINIDDSSINRNIESKL